MQWTGMPETFSGLGHMFFIASKGPGKRIEKYVANRGDGIVSMVTKSNRSLKALGFMTGSFAVVSSAILIRSRMKRNGYFWTEKEVSVVLPQLTQNVDDAMRYASIGSISQMESVLEDISEIVLMHPQLKKHVKYQEPLLVDVSPKTLATKQMNDTMGHEIENGLVLSTDSNDLIKSLEGHTLDKQIEFHNELDYIRHIGITNRCKKLYYSAAKNAKKGNIKKCANALAELWEFTVSLHPTPIVVLNSENEIVFLSETELTRIMKMCHSQYCFYLINAASKIGNEMSERNKNVEKEHMVAFNATMLNMVWKNLENAKNYAQTYFVWNDDLKDAFQQTWQQKQTQFSLT